MLHKAIEISDKEIQNCKTMKEWNEKCLVTAKGCLRGIDIIIERFIPFATSSVDSIALKDISLHEVPIFKRFSHPIFLSEFFVSKSFADF